MAVPDGKFIIVVCCAECGKELIRSQPITQNDYALAVISGPLVTKPCPNGCRATFSDCNINTRDHWIREDGTPCEMQPGN